MEEVPQLGKLLELMAREQEKTPRNVWAGIGAQSFAITRLLGLDPNSRGDAVLVQDAVQQGLDEGLIERRAEHFLRLTPEGWRRTRGAVPWSDRDEEFFQAVVNAHRDGMHLRQGQWVSGVDVARSLDPPIPEDNVWNLAERFEAAGLGDCRYTQGVWFRPNYHARQRYGSDA